MNAAPPQILPVQGNETETRPFTPNQPGVLIWPFRCYLPLTTAVMTRRPILSCLRPPRPSYSPSSPPREQ
ncbi:hypothetical protein E2C01_058893 [Portunus trituberculatus]|uniref:Uncharacterized protein n=1 Tax=Portunus trituberculatus TaxID=210409 RepID=A0A5B7H3Z0_PORTR|nr:hypothetical protein [Portunus trituberculatus]